MAVTGDRQPRRRAAGLPPITLEPVLGEAQERALEAVLACPFSYVSTNGSAWLSSVERSSAARDQGSSHLLVTDTEQDVVIGAVSWTGGQTPGFVRLWLTSCADARWTSEVVHTALRSALAAIVRSAETRRAELLVPAYAHAVMTCLAEHDDFIVEGVLVDRFFIDGRYWDGIQCRADLDGLVRDQGPRVDPVLISELRRRVVRDLVGGSHL